MPAAELQLATGSRRFRRDPVASLVVGVALAVAAACSGSGGGGDRVAPTTTPPSGAEPGSVAADLPEPRTEVAGAAWHGGIAVAGGLRPDGGASSRLDVWDPATDRWTPGPELPLALHHHGMAAFGDRLYVAGGYANEPGGEWLSQARVFSLGPGEASWREEPAMGRPRGALALATTTGRLVAVGGVAEGSLTPRVESWAPGEPRWRVEPDLGEAREHLAAAGLGERVYAIAGRRGGIDTNLGTVESWAPGERAWRTEPGLNLTRGGIGAAVVDAEAGGGRICVAGGEEPGGTIAAVECFSGGGWRVVEELAHPRHGLAVVGLDGRLHVVGGGPEPGLFVSGTHEVLEP